MNIDDGTRIKFNQYIGGLYYYGTKNMENNNTNNQVTNYSFLNTVQTNKSYFHKREIERVDAARIVQQLLGWPPTKSLKEAIGKTK